jgi:hypothetical protein
LSGSVSGEITPHLNNSNIFVYLHCDRSYYLPGESISFKAYFLDKLQNRSYPSGDTLIVALIDQEGQEAAVGRYPVTNSLMGGNMELPDALTEGNYMLVAFTLKSDNLSPEKMYSRVIEIRKYLASDLTMKVSLKDSLYKPGSMLTAQISFTGSDHKPVSAGFSYQLIGKSGEFLSGKNKADNEGTATITLKLPEFNNDDELKLLIAPSYKGTKKITGIIIPTRFNYYLRPESKLSSSETSHLNIRLNTVNLSDEKKDKVRLDILVTDDKGAPVMANLSVSATNMIPLRFYSIDDNILSFINGENNASSIESGTDKYKYFARRLVQLTQYPGVSFIVQDKNNPKKLHKKEKSLNLKNQYGYSSDRNIFDIIMQIRPYHVDNGKINFGTTGMNSINNLDGALIVVDGIKMGTDISILNTIPVPDIAHITVSTNVMDIQRYSSLNSVGIIEIFMKKTDDYRDGVESEGKTKSNTLFWGPEVITDRSGNASVSFNINNKSSEVLITVVGVSSNGIYGSDSTQFTVK